VCLYVIDNLVPSFGDDRAVMPLGPEGTTALLLNASRLFERKGMDWQAYYSRTGSVKFPLGPVAGWNTNVCHTGLEPRTSRPQTHVCYSHL
tara:strand:+ start:576 stop:848 length:273 start_codon:yes stop_codon:yes gene_type:complete